MRYSAFIANTVSLQLRLLSSAYLLSSDSSESPAFAIPQNVTIDDQNGDAETGVRLGMHLTGGLKVPHVQDAFLAQTLRWRLVGPGWMERSALRILLLE